MNHLNMDFSQRVVIHTAQQIWQSSPAPGVWRKPLEREARESGHTTSVVRYDPGCTFRPHPHPLGEEILVLKGVFSDEHGDYPAGSYLRNPPGSQHAPFSQEGCVILVKLNQFSQDDLSEVRIATNNVPWQTNSEGIQERSLHEFGDEHVRLLKLNAGEQWCPANGGGEEILVLSGTLNDEFGAYPSGCWIRNPQGNAHHLFAEQETVIWCKTGHLAPR